MKRIWIWLRIWKFFAAATLPIIGYACPPVAVLKAWDYQTWGGIARATAGWLTLCKATYGCNAEMMHCAHSHHPHIRG